MAQRFDLTAQLQLQAPTNTRQVVNQIRSQLQNVSVSVDVQANAKAVTQVNKSLQSTSKQAKNASNSIGVLNKNLSEAARRFGVITLATGTMLSFAQSVKRAVREAIEFERELVKISQVTGKSVQQLTSLTQEITRLSTSLGVSSSKLLETSRVLAQAGFSAEDTRKALDVLAKTTLGSSFDDITKTVEGAIAVLRQFRAEAMAAGGEVKFLEQTLDAINSVSKSFAVESSDLIAVIQRVGGVFSSAGGSVNELIALFTSVRATTRESAETIATGLRTIFTRIQRTDTVNQLEQLGISLRDAQGRFVGAFEAVKRLSIGLSALDPRDYRFSEIVEELGGFRQIGKVIPLIQQFTVAQDALNVAQSASGSVAADAVTAQQSLAVQAQKVREEFAALIRQFADSSTFRSIASAALSLASALIKIGEALEPVLPLLTSLLALKIGQGLAPGLGALLGFGGRRKYGGGVIRKFASGGFVPGTGNSDTVPAMLTPGEFVIRKSSAENLGVDTLLAMNQNKFSTGIKVAKSGRVNKTDISSASNNDLQELLNNPNVQNKASSIIAIQAELNRRKDSPKIARLKDGVVGGLFLQEGQGGSRGISKDLKGIQLPSSFPKVDRIEGNIYTGLLDKRASSEIRSQLEPNIINAVQSAASNTIKSFEIPPLDIDESQAAKNAVSRIDTTAIEGYIFEAFISALSGAQLSEYGATFDYVNPSSSAKSRLKNIFGPDPISGRLLDAKRTLSSDSVQSGKSSIANKIVSGINKDLLKREDFIVRNSGGSIPRFASGGGVGTDTVPALLTPGEFVINKESANRIGYSNLASMNRDGVAKFAKGGAVGVQRFARGGLAGAAGNIPAFMSSQLLDKTAERLAAALNARIAQEQQRIQQGNKNISADQALNLATLKVGTQFKGLESDNVKLVKTIRDLEKEGKGVIASNSKYRQALAAVTGSMKPGQFMGQVAGGLKDPGVRQQAIGKIDRVAGAAQQFVFLGSAAAALASQFGGLSDVQEKAIAETAGFVTGIVGIGGTIVQLITSMMTASAANLVSAGSDAVEAVSSGVAAGADMAEAGASGMAAAAVMAFVIAITLAVAAVVGIAAVYKYSAALARAQAAELAAASEDQLKSIQELTGSTQEFARLQKEMVEKQKEAAQNDSASTGALTGGAIGAAIGLVLLGPIGMVLGAILGAVIGGEDAKQREAERQADIARRFRGELELSALALAETTEAQGLFKQALSDIDIEENLQPDERIRRRLGAQSGASPFNNRSVATANRQLARLATEAGKSLSELTEEDFANDPELLSIFKNAKQNLSLGLDGLAATVAESRKTLAEAAAEEITGEQTFDEIMQANGLFAQSLRASQQAIMEEARARVASLQTQLASETDPEKRKQIQEQIDRARERETKQLEDQEQGYRDMAEEARKNAEELKQSRLAQEAYRKSLLKIKEFEKVSIAVEHALDGLDQSISNIAAMINGGDFNFTRNAPASIGDISMVGDRRGFNAGMDQLAMGLGAGGRELANKAKETSAFMAKAQRKLVGRQFADLGASIDTEDILKDLNLDINKLSREQFATIDTELRKAAQDGIISEEEFDAIFAPVLKEGQKAADALKQANDIRNRELKYYQDFLGSLEEQRKKEIESRQKLARTQAKGEELMAKARGRDLSPAQKEAARNQEAQIPLNRFGLKAGDVQGVSNARNAAQGRLATIQNEIAQGRGTPALIKEQKELAAAINATTNELDRLSDQSEKAADIMAEIEKERQKRQVGKDIVEDFVVGGNEQRQKINEAFAGIQQAVGSGTLQMQPEEQRRATVDMLDKLKDIQIPGAGGMTGSQVKEQLIMRDAMSMGLSPEAAKAIYSSTTKEDQLIEAMDNLARQQVQAAQANAQFEAQKTQVLLNSEQQLIQALKNLANVMAQAANIPFAKGGEVPRYLSAGGSLFRPKGTDTVPAMLTPGEFVIRKSSVDKIGTDALEALNSGSASIQAFGAGGRVSRRSKPQGGVDVDVHGGFLNTGIGASLLGDRVPAADAGARAAENNRRYASQTATAPSSSLPTTQQPFYSGTKPRVTEFGDQGYTQGQPGSFMNAINNTPTSTADDVFGTGQYVTPQPQREPLPIRSVSEQWDYAGRAARAKASESIKARREQQKKRMSYVNPNGLHGLDPRNPHHKQATRHWQGVYGVQNRYNARAAQRNQWIMGMQRRQMMMSQATTSNYYRTRGYNSGGFVASGTDAVPAMLTPGEFVMNRGAVQNNGLSALNKMNRGASYFKRGGFVGGKTQYLENGGTVNGSGADGGISTVFDNFIGNFSNVFDNIVKSFSGIQTSLSELAQKMSGFTMQHTVTVEGLISVGGLNLESIKQELSTSIGQMVAEEVKKVMNDNNKNFKAG